MSEATRQRDWMTMGWLTITKNIYNNCNYLSYLTGCGTWPFGSQIGSIVIDSVADVAVSYSMRLDRDEIGCAGRLLFGECDRKLEHTTDV